MALHVPSNLNRFATYTTSRRNEILLGFEYEIDHPDVGPPPTATNWALGYNYSDHQIKLPKHFRRAPAQKHPIRDLPNFYHLSYEGLGPGGGSGYEIKSCIAPLCIHKSIIKRCLFPNVRFNNKPNGRENNGGIHVSISRDKVTIPLSTRVFTFFHHNLPTNVLLKLSERTPRTLSHFAQTFLDHQTWSSHYAIINNGNNDRYELRLFAAQKHLLLPALEMADSVFNLAKETEKITLENWTHFIRRHLKYRNIHEHVVNKLK